MNDLTYICWIVVSLLWGLNDIILIKDYLQGIVWILLLIVLCIEFVKKSLGGKNEENKI